MKTNMVEIHFKSGRPEAIVADRAKMVMPADKRGGILLAYNLRGDSEGRGKGLCSVRMRDVKSITPFNY